MYYSSICALSENKKKIKKKNVFTVNQQDPVVQQLYDEFNCKNTVKYLISLLTVERNMAAFGLAW